MTENKYLKFEKAIEYPNFTKVWFRYAGRYEYVKIDGRGFAVNAIVEFLKKSTYEDPELTVEDIRKAVKLLKTKPMFAPKLKMFNDYKGMEYGHLHYDEFDAFRYTYGMCFDNNPNYGIRNLKKVKLGKKTTVELTDGRKGVAQVQGDDVYDPQVAFALAYTAAQFESKTAYNNFVNKLVKKNKLYGIYAKGLKLKVKKENSK